MIFKVVTKWPGDVSRSHNGGDYRRGYWLYPEGMVNGVLLYRKEYFSSYEGGTCPVTARTWPCEQCQEGHSQQEYERVSAFEVWELLQQHPYKIHARPTVLLSKKYMELEGFHVEIDGTVEKEGVSALSIQQCRENAEAFWKELSTAGKEDYNG